MKQVNVNTQETWLKVLGKGMVTLPKKWREDMGVATGDVIKAKKEGNKVVIEAQQTESAPYRIYNDAEINEFLRTDTNLNENPSTKRNLLKSMAGALKDTNLNSDSLWRKALKKKSRRDSITL